MSQPLYFLSKNVHFSTQLFDMHSSCDVTKLNNVEGKKTASMEDLLVSAQISKPPRHCPPTDSLSIPLGMKKRKAEESDVVVDADHDLQSCDLKRPRLKGSMPNSTLTEESGETFRDAFENNLSKQVSFTSPLAVGNGSLGETTAEVPETAVSCNSSCVDADMSIPSIIIPRIDPNLGEDFVKSVIEDARFGTIKSVILTSLDESFQTATVHFTEWNAKDHEAMEYRRRLLANEEIEISCDKVKGWRWVISMAPISFAPTMSLASATATSSPFLDPSLVTFASLSESLGQDLSPRNIEGGETATSEGGEDVVLPTTSFNADLPSQADSVTQSLPVTVRITGLPLGSKDCSEECLLALFSSFRGFTGLTYDTHSACDVVMKCQDDANALLAHLSSPGIVMSKGGTPLTGSLLDVSTDNNHSADNVRSMQDENKDKVAGESSLPVTSNDKGDIKGGQSGVNVRIYNFPSESTCSTDLLEEMFQSFRGFESVIAVPSKRYCDVSMTSQDDADALLGHLSSPGIRMTLTSSPLKGRIYDAALTKLKNMNFKLAKRYSVVELINKLKEVDNTHDMEETVKILLHKRPRKEVMSHRTEILRYISPYESSSCLGVTQLMQRLDGPGLLENKDCSKCERVSVCIQGFDKEYAKEILEDMFSCFQGYIEVDHRKKECFVRMDTVGNANVLISHLLSPGICMTRGASPLIGSLHLERSGHHSAVLGAQGAASQCDSGRSSSSRSSRKDSRSSSNSGNDTRLIKIVSESNRSKPRKVTRVDAVQRNDKKGETGKANWMTLAMNDFLKHSLIVDQ